MEDKSSRMLFVDDVRSSSSSRTDHRQLTMSPIYSKNIIILMLFVKDHKFEGTMLAFQTCNSIN